jgi:hypothetical protein
MGEDGGDVTSSDDEFRAALARAFEAAQQEREPEAEPASGAALQAGTPPPAPATGPEAVAPEQPLSPEVVAAIDEAVARRLPAAVEEHLDRLLAEAGTRPQRASGRRWRPERHEAS